MDMSQVSDCELKLISDDAILYHLCTFDMA